ncbi:3'-5' exonuclease [Pseudoalteromonas obscura]|uniref:3'-5' exonuclease n=1 Tax=Pseudoalteromonas obscura TaxID=3048491 RepID=A0ABT7ELI6_9GAMM|nr:3'-5' exonuclease [Pseudoalteromonas sp. P94(2023)]MDK2595898.1 3'-5' exonuclease [Pseudoalteromonas sp. P94(2023)]
MKWRLPRFFQRTESALWLNSELLVVDLELTGLDPNSHEIVSIAWVLIKNGRIELEQAQHKLNCDVKQLAQSPVYHGIGEHQLVQSGEHLERIIKSFGEELASKSLVCHNASLDWGFLQKYMNKFDVAVTPAHIIDTLKIEKNKLLRSQTYLAQDQLTLAACRSRYGLPTYQNHNALSDALATAELLLAHVSHLDRQESIKLRNLVY